jgi:putative transposase
MPDYRRARVPGATYFFTVVTHLRRPLFQGESAKSLLGECLREAKDRWPFTVDAMVLLPDHLHALWTLPRGDDRYSVRWGWIKKEFAKRWLSNGGRESPVSNGRRLERRAGVWQPRFWEHTISDETDFEQHFDYIHFNPVKHGHVRDPRDWQASTIHRWIAAGVYAADWACVGQDPPPMFPDLSKTTGE